MKKVLATVYADTGDGASPDDFEVMCAIRKFIVDGLKSTGDNKRHAVRLAEAYMGDRAQEQPGSIEDAVVETISKLKECGAFDKGDC
jgi:hypothetical protein